MRTVRDSPRPGYGGSTLKPHRTINDWATEDCIAVVNALRVDRFITCGVSTGGSYVILIVIVITIGQLPPVDTFLRSYHSMISITV